MKAIIITPSHSGVNVRVEPNPEAESIGVVDSGDIVEALATQGDWTNVCINGVFGWVHSQYVVLESETVNGIFCRKLRDKLRKALRIRKTNESTNGIEEYDPMEEEALNGLFDSIKKAFRKVKKTFGFSGLAGFMKGQTLYVNTAKDPLSMRKAASTSGAKICAIPKGAKVTVADAATISNGGNVWLKVTYNGKTGYVAQQYLAAPATTAKTTSAAPKTTTTNSTATTKAAAPKVTTTTTKTASAAPKTTTTNSTTTTKAAAPKVTTTTTKTASAAPKTTTTNSTTTTKTAAAKTSVSKSAFSKGQTLYVHTNGSALNLRQYPSTSASSLIGLSNGTAVTVADTSTTSQGGYTWLKITCGSKSGYVATKYLSASKPSTNNTKKTTPNTTNTTNDNSTDSSSTDNDNNSNNQQKDMGLTENAKKYIKIGVGVVGAAAVAYLGYKLCKGNQEKSTSKGKKGLSGISAKSKKRKTTSKKSRKSTKRIGSTKRLPMK